MKNNSRSGGNEINPDNEGLQQLRDQWQKMLMFTMHKLGVKEVIIDADDMEAFVKASPPNEKSYLVVIGRKNEGPHGGFKFVLTHSRAEMMEVCAKWQGQG